MKVIILVVIVSLSLYSCSKDTNSNTVPLPNPDTLSLGWSKVNISKETFTDIYFINNSVGYALSKQVYKSTDGGQTWNKIADIFGDNIAALQNGKVFIVKGSDSLYQSFDYGKTF